jgi:hypothetical protein
LRAAARAPDIPPRRSFHSTQEHRQVSWLWIGIAVVAAVLGLARRAVPRRGPYPTVDDEAVRRILDSGRLPAAEDDGDDEPLDMEEAARAEEEFFAESWDEPEELQP